MSNDKKFTYTLEAQYKGSGEFGKLQNDLKSISKIESMKKLGRDVLDLNRKFQDAQRILKQQAQEMKNSDAVTKKASDAYKKQQETVKRLAVALEKKRDVYQKSKNAVKSLGIDTAKLTQEENRLSAAAKTTGNVWAARKALGVKSHKDVRAEINRLTLAYDHLKKSGKLTTSELLQAKLTLNTQIRELRAQTTSWGTALTKVRSAFLGMAGVSIGVAAAFREFSQFEKGMAEVYTLVDTSKEKFSEFKKEINSLSGILPQANKDLTISLYDIISAGVELEKSTSVLELSAKAAVAGVTETKTAVNVGLGVMNAYGKSVNDLSGIYDVLFQTVKERSNDIPCPGRNYW